MTDARFTISAEAAEALANLDKVAREFRRLGTAAQASGGAVTAGFAKTRTAVTSIRDSLAQTRAQFVRLFSVFQTGRAAGALIQLGEQLGKLSEQAGLSVERLNALRFAADQTDTDFNALAKAFAKLSVASAEGAEGSPKAAKLLAGLGIITRDPNERLLALAERFRRVADEGDRTALAVALFGQRIGPELVPLLSQGEEGLRCLQERGQQVAGGLDKEGVAALRAFGDQLDEVKAAAEGLAAEFLRGLTPAATELGQNLRAALTDPTVRQGIATLSSALDELGKILLAVFGARLLLAARNWAAGLSTNFATVRASLLSLQGALSIVTAAFAGFQIGGFLYQESITARRAGVVMLSTLEELVVRARFAKEALAAVFSADTIEAATARLEQRIQGIRDKFQESFEAAALPLTQPAAALPAPAAAGGGPPLDVRGLFGGLAGEGGGGGGGKSPVKTLQDEIDELVASLKVQIATFGESSTQVQLYELRSRGAGDAQLALAESLIKDLAAKERDAEATDAQTRALDEMEQKARELLKPFDELTLAHLEYMQTLDELEQLQDLGRLSTSEYQTAVQNLTTQFEQLNLKANESLGEMSEFAREAARNIQDSFADFFFNIMQGKFSDLASDFKQTLDRMVANALAAKLANALFGETFLGGDGKSGGGAIGGLFGKLLGAFGFKFAGGGAVSGPGSGTSDSILARLSAGEYVVRAEAVRRWGVGFLDAINGLTLPAVPRLAFAEGGWSQIEAASAIPPST